MGAGSGSGAVPETASVHCFNVSGNGIGGKPKVARRAFCSRSAAANSSGAIVLIVPDTRPTCTNRGGLDGAVPATGPGGGAADGNGPPKGFRIFGAGGGEAGSSEENTIQRSELSLPVGATGGTP